MVGHKAVEKKDEESLKKDCHEDVQLPAKFKMQRPPFPELLKKLKSMCRGHLDRPNVSKHRVYLLNIEARPVHSALYQSVPTAEQLTAKESNLMLV